MYQALYRKYRPQTFEDVVDQNNVKKILINSIKNNKISHAYLFSGPRGIGKTSIAKIFARAVNCLEFEKNNDVCLECDSCKDIEAFSTDIIEMDAASNNGVEQIRDLKSKINIVPSKLKYKVYIIDEVHMLTNNAFNALLKTLEEPPSHVIFILATTEFYEVPETIVSRCQCYNFSRISNESLKNRLRYIAEHENINVDDDVLMEIAISSNGGLRDSISMLDKLSSFSNNNITFDDFVGINGLILQSDIIEMYNNVVESNTKKVLNIITKIDNSGYDFGKFVERLMLYIRDLIVENCCNNVNSFDLKYHVLLVNKLNDLNNVLKTSLNPLIMMEVSFLNLIQSEQKDGFLFTKNNEFNDIKEEKLIKKEKINVKTESKKNILVKSSNKINEDIKSIRINNALAKANMAFKKSFVANFSKIIDYKLDNKFGKVVQLLSNSIPVIVSDSYVVITNKMDSTIERMYDSYEEIESLLKIINNHEYRVVFVNEKDFENIKNKYINDKKNGIIYKCQEETDVLVNKVEKSANNELLTKALGVFGSDLVEIEEE